VNIFSGGRENGLRDEHVADMRVAHGDAKTFRERSVNIAMVARERRSEDISHAKKNELTINNRAEGTACSCFSYTPTHACARNSRTVLCFRTCESFY
jgi:hypothetical protein